MILLAEIFLILIYGIRNDDECQAMCESLPSIRNGKEIILDPPLERNKFKNSSAALLKFQPWIESQLSLVPPRSWSPHQNWVEYPVIEEIPFIVSSKYLKELLLVWLLLICILIIIQYLEYKKRISNTKIFLTLFCRAGNWLGANYSSITLIAVRTTFFFCGTSWAKLGWAVITGAIITVLAIYSIGDKRA